MAYRFREVAKGFVRLAARSVFPHFCVGCGKEGELLCPYCREEAIVPARGFFYCFGCGDRSDFGTRCLKKKCRRNEIKEAFAVASYSHSDFGPLLRAWKYERIEEGRKFATQAFDAATRKSGAALRLAGDLIVPVPMNSMRLAYRGFNQAHELAATLAESLEIELANPMETEFRWKSQAKTNVDERGAASGVAFRVCGDVAGRRVILVDDVTTSGATIRACAFALLEAGASSVSVVTFLKG